MNLFAEHNSLKNKVACLLILILLSVIVYFNSLKGAFQFDDRNLLNKEWIADIYSFNKGVSFKFTFSSLRFELLEADSIDFTNLHHIYTTHFY